MFNARLKRDIARQYAERLMASRKIVYCQMTLTHRCQYLCSHCYHREIDSECLDMPIDDVIYAIESIAEFSRVSGKILRVDFTGGDPLLHPKLSDVIEHCRRKRIVYGLKCNPDQLMRLTPQELKMLIPECTGISLSLDGPKIFHDAIRGKGSFDRVLSAARVVNQSGVFLRINATVSKMNAGLLPALLQVLAQSDIKVGAFTWARYWSFEDPQSVISLSELPAIFDAYLSVLEDLYENESFFLDPREGGGPRINSFFKEHLWLPHLLQRGYIDNNFIEKARGEINGLNCSAMRDSFIVDSVDKVYKCRKSSRWVVDLRKPGVIGIDEDCLGSCGACVNRNICLGCPAMIQGHRSDKDGCPYYEKGSSIP